MLRIALPLSLILVGAVSAVPQSAAPLKPENRAELVKDLSEGLERVYVFPEVAEQMVALIQGKLERGEYDSFDTVPAFAQALTADLQSISHDKHLNVRPFSPPPPRADGQAPDEAELARRRLEQQRFDNFGFHELKRLEGNVGYLDLRGFQDAGAAGDTAHAAMRFLSHSSALIVDLRNNGGGSPSMIQLITSYFFDEPQHLNSFYVRQSDSTQQFWTQANVPGPKMLDTPIFVLTSGQTFSAAEEFTYNLKNMERATIVGETTGGGAHPVERMFSDMGDGHHAQATLPFGRAINPITGTNWEGTGIEPHVKVPAPEALAVAHELALEAVAEKEDDPARRAALDWAREGLRAKREPAEIPRREASRLVGEYGPRRISMDEGRLYYQRDEGPRHALSPMGDDRFLVGDIGFFRIRFERDASGRPVRLVGLYADGRTDSHERL